MKLDLLKKSERLAGIASAIDMSINNGGINSLSFASKLLDQLDKQCYLLNSAISLRQRKLEFLKEEDPKKKKGIVYERKDVGSYFRCWSCRFLGDFNICINFFLNRPACRLFRLNKTLTKNRKLLLKVKKTHSILFLKPPVIKTFSEHLTTCKTCAKLFDSDKDKKILVSSKHYRKYVSRRKKRLATFFAKHGVKFRDDYINGWEE